MTAFWFSAWLLAMLAQRPVLSANAIRQIQALEAEKAARTPAQRKIASTILDAVRMRRGEPVATGVPSLRVDVDVDRGGRVLVDMRADISDAMVRHIGALGGAVVSRVDAYGAIRARIPIDSLESLAALPEVRSIRPADIAATSQYSTSKVNTTQGDVAHRAALARFSLGFDGTGIGIGVLSNGVSTLANRQATGDLPATVTVLPGQAGLGDEGTAMLEIVHDLAPGASLYFATAVNSQASFAANIEALCDAGANIIVDDVFYYAEPVFQDGIVAQGVIAAMNKGCSYFSAAGNSGNQDDGSAGVWEGDYSASTATLPGLAGTLHDFGGTISNRIVADPRYITLKWSDAIGSSGNDYDLYLLDATLTTVLASSRNVQIGGGDPVELISSDGYNDVGNRLVILAHPSAAGRFLHLDTHGGILEYSTAGAVSGHAAVEGAFAVAAVNVASAAGGEFTGGASNPIEYFSSDGPRRVFYQPDGTPITPGDLLSSGGAVRQKPDIAAADGVATATPGFNPFFGTSAAAPHAAAIAALVLDAAGTATSLTSLQLRDHLTATALDIEASGVDRDSGAGLLDAYAAVLGAQNSFSDDPLVPNVTPVKRVHIVQLRARIDTLRVTHALAAYGWAEQIATSATAIRAAHIVEMRKALNEVYAAAGRTLPTYTVAAGMPIKAVYITELRAAVLALESP